MAFYDRRELAGEPAVDLITLFRHRLDHAAAHEQPMCCDKALVLFLS
jgi:hypothetical protein